MTTTTERPHSTSNSRHRRRIGEVLQDFPAVHLGLGLLGNLLFVVGSVMFFYPTIKTAAIWVFVVASLGMFIGSLGQMFVRVEKARRQHH